MRFWSKSALLMIAGLASFCGASHGDTSLQDIQLGVIPENTIVQIDGVVVTGVGRFGYFVQEPDEHPTYGRQYSGAWIFTNNYPTVSRGDVVNIRGKYYEYFGMAEIDQFCIDCQGQTAIVGQGIVPDPVSLTIPEINDTGPFAEAYECVLVRVDRDDPSLIALPDHDTYAEWVLKRAVGADSILMEQWSAHTDFVYDAPESASVVTFAQGILTYNRDRYKIAPRNCEEDLGVPCVPHVRGAYATNPDGVGVQFGVPLNETSAENVANYELVSGAAVLQATLDPMNPKRVYLRTENLGNGNEETIIVQNILSVQGVAMTEPESMDFITGITPISQIQYAFDPASDDRSPLLGSVVTIKGRVSAVDGSNYYFVQDGDGGEWDGIYVRVARNTPLSVGDEVKVAGAVNEFAGQTQIAFRNGIEYYVKLGTVAPVVTNTVTAAQIPYDGSFGTARTGEPWECNLVRIESARLDSLEGVVGPTFGEWLLFQEGAADTAMMDLDEVNGLKSYDACVDDIVHATGILAGTFSNYRISPRLGRGYDVQVIYDNPACEPTAVGDAAALDRGPAIANAPNPFNPRTTIRFRLPEAASVRLQIHDPAGRCVRTLLQDQPLPAGQQQSVWDGRDDEGRAVSTGTYFARLSVSGGEITTKLILLK